MRDTFLVIEGLEAGVRLLGCRPLELCLPTVLAGLPHEIISVETRPTFASVISAGGRYRLYAPALGEPTYQKDPVNAACELVGLIARQLTYGREDRLALHAAAVAVNDALIVFPAGRRAGKSLLTVALAQLGARVFGDDVLPIRLVPGAPIEGIALGASPRIRLPLPVTAASLAKKLEGVPAVENDQYRYLAVPQLASAGEQLPVGAFVTLRPAEQGPPRLKQVSRGATLSVLLKQNFGRSGHAEALLAGLHALASSAISLELAYTEPLESAALLMSELAPRLRSAAPKFSLELPTTTLSGAIPPTDRSLNGRAYRRHEGAMLRQLDGECFAASSDGSRILHLNEGLFRIWTLLADPAKPQEVVELMQAAYSDVSPRQITADVTAAFAGLATAGLIVPSDTLLD